MNPRRYVDCGFACGDDPTNDHVMCSYIHDRGEAAGRADDEIGKPKYACPYEWEISAVKS